MKVFEYGSGGSTLFFGSRVAQITSVEHTPSWHVTVMNFVASLQLSNVALILREPGMSLSPTVASSSEQQSFESSRHTETHASFYDYVTTIDSFPDHSLDLVLVDGRCRVASVKRSLKKIRPGGHIVLDNSERADYLPIHEYLGSFRAKHFGGICPYSYVSWQTSAWRIA